MADEVEMIPVAGAEPPKPTLKLAPAIHKPVAGTSTATLKPGLKLPPKPGLATGLKLPPKPGATAAGALRPGLKLPTQNALKPGVRLPPKPMIRKPGATVSAAPVPKPIAVDAQGVGKLPTVSATAVARGDSAPVAVDIPKPMEALKSVTQKLKGITQEIPQQAILHKTGIIAEGVMSDAQKEAAKHKTARISLADAMGVAPVKDEAAPMKTIRIKRPINIPSATAASPAQPAPEAASTAAPAAAAPAAAAPAAAPAVTMTQRKTLKIARPGSTGVRPAGKFGVKRPATQATTVVKSAPAVDAKPADGEVADIPDIPAMPTAPVPMAARADEGASWVWTLSAIVQLAACAVLGALVWFLYENTQLETFCGGLGWGA